MSAILKSTIILLLASLNNCNNETLKISKERNPGSTVNTVSVDAQFTCSSNSKLKKASATYSYENTVPCNGYQQRSGSATYDITFNDEDGCETKSLKLENLSITAIYINGNEYYRATQQITDSVCKGGKVTIIAFIANNDCLSCYSEDGVTSIKSVKASFEIEGGKCDSKCTGTLDVNYDPGVTESKLIG